MSTTRNTYTTARQWLYVYGLTEDEYRRIERQQGGACAICGETPELLAVDHDHRSGAVRGLLCDRCNRAVGHLRDSPGICTRAAEYLRGSVRSGDRTER